MLSDNDQTQEGLQIQPPPGLPPGWQAIQKKYMTGSRRGTAYVRYQNTNHKNVLSVKAAIELDAKDKGIDPSEALSDYNHMKVERLRSKQHEREQRGVVIGERRNQAQQLFRDTCGPLDGSTVMNFDGWTTRWMHLPKCGQTHVFYKDTYGTEWRLLKDIEVALGLKIMKGGEQDIRHMVHTAREKAKEQPKRQARPMRRDSAENADSAVPSEPRRRSSRGTKAGTPEGYDDGTGKPGGSAMKSRKRANNKVGVTVQHKETSSMTISFAYDVSSTELSASGAPAHEVPAIQQSAADIHNLLVRYGFREDTQLVAVLARTPGHEILDTLLKGLYFEMAEQFGGRPCYQRVRLSQDAQGKHTLVCSPLYIFWSQSHGRWKVGELDDARVGIAFCTQDIATPADVEGPWMVYEVNDTRTPKQARTQDRSQKCDRSQSCSSSCSRSSERGWGRA